jgi:ADP-heptose:LPS heptosyltransferase
MAGRYLVRKKYVAAGLAALDQFCGLASVFGRRSSPCDNSNIRSILVSQGAHLGDLIMTLPTLHWLRQHRPDLRIGLVVGSWANPMIGGIAELYDRCYVADHFLLDRANRPRKEKIVHHRLSWKQAAADIRRDGYDAAIECFPFLQNNIPLLFASGIPTRVGFTSGGFGPLLTHPVTWRHASRPYLDYPRDLLKELFADASLHGPLEAYYPRQPVPASQPQAPYVLVQTGTGNPIREWPEPRWIELVSQLHARGMTVVVAGVGARERSRSERIQEAVPGIINFCDKLPWNDFVALVAGASHVVCLESSTSHVAAAFRIPSTVIMPGTNDHGQFGPANINARILSFPTPCAPCFRTEGCEHMACLREVSVQQAVEAVVGPA